jgi:hypothetical protein
MMNGQRLRAWCGPVRPDGETKRKQKKREDSSSNDESGVWLVMTGMKGSTTYREVAARLVLSARRCTLLIAPKATTRTDIE